MEAQLQIRQNVLEAQEYASDLLAWQRTLAAKQAAAPAPDPESRDLPGVRGRAAGDVPAAPPELQAPALGAARAKQPGQPQRAASPAAHTYKNYGKWDAFDVDAALAAAADEPTPAAAAAAKQQKQKQQQPSPAAAVPAPLPPDAGTLKDRGNKLFQAGHLGEAVDCYSQSLALQPSAAAFANRALVQLKLGRPAEAEHDCSAALGLEPGYIKALHRRGSARSALGRALEAAGDFEAGLRLEPGNKTLQADRDAALAAHLAQQGLETAEPRWQAVPVTRAQQPTQQPAASQAQAPASAAQPAGSSGRTSPLPAAAKQPAAGPSSPKVELLPAAAPKDAAATAAKRSSSSSGRSSPAPPATPGAAAAGGTAGGGSRQLAPSSSSVSAAAQAAAAQLAARRAESMRPPKTSHNFEAAWRSFKGSLELQARYLSLLQPELLPALFKSSLTAPLVTSILSAALAAAAGHAGSEPGLSAAQAVHLAEQLARVPRFDMMAMCLTARDKAALRALWDEAAAAASPDMRGQLAALRPKYRL